MPPVSIWAKGEEGETLLLPAAGLKPEAEGSVLLRAGLNMALAVTAAMAAVVVVASM